jgi:hypothetical protein
MLCSKTINLPRQARDKHRESTQKKTGSGCAQVDERHRRSRALSDSQPDRGESCGHSGAVNKSFPVCETTFLMKNDLLPPRQARDKCKEKLNKSRFCFHAGSLWQGNIGLLQEPLGFERRAEQCLPGPRHLSPTHYLSTYRYDAFLSHRLAKSIEIWPFS